MKWRNYEYDIPIILWIILWIILAVIALYLDNRKERTPSEEFKIIEDTIIIREPQFFIQTPEEGLIEALEYYNVQHPNIVYAQALLETGHFKSNVCKTYNNLFGLYNSRIKDYYRFKHWSESVVAYLSYIQYRYNPSKDYYQFLSDINYAEDPEYISKLKRLEDKYDKRRIAEESR